LTPSKETHPLRKTLTPSRKEKIKFSIEEGNLKDDPNHRLPRSGRSSSTRKKDPLSPNSLKARPGVPDHVSPKRTGSASLSTTRKSSPVRNGHDSEDIIRSPNPRGTRTPKSVAASPAIDRTPIDTGTPPEHQIATPVTPVHRLDSNSSNSLTFSGRLVSEEIVQKRLVLRENKNHAANRPGKITPISNSTNNVIHSVANPHQNKLKFINHQIVILPEEQPLMWLN